MGEAPCRADVLYDDEAYCICCLPSGHESPHLCDCLYSWKADGTMVRLGVGSILGVEGWAWNGREWAEASADKAETPS